MFDELNKYKNKNHFFFRPEDGLSEVCNAPNDKSGIYLVYALVQGKIELVYIGISGLEQKDGTLKTRKAGLGGMKDRIVNGHHFGKTPRRRSWPIQMLKENIEALDVYWWVTYENELRDFPRRIEESLLKKHMDLYGCLPRWNKQL